MTIKVFISYKSEYRDFARSVKSELNEWGYGTWLDVDNIQPGDYFRHKIQEGLDSSDVLLMVLTEEAQLSREVMAEVDYFLDVAKKPVVPLRHRECKPLYIFVSIQYIDFVKDQANGFVQLKNRLNELAQSVASTPASEARPEPISEQDMKPGAAVIDDVLVMDKEKKEAVLDDFITGGMAEEAVLPKPPPPPPKPIIQQPPEYTSIPASPITAPQRQAEYVPMQQTASRSKSNRSLLWPLAAVASFVIVVGAVVLLNSNETPPLLSLPPQETSPLVWIVAVAVVGVGGLIGWQFIRNRAIPKRSAPSSSAGMSDRETVQETSSSTSTGVIGGGGGHDGTVVPTTTPGFGSLSGSMGVTGSDITFKGVILRHKDFGDYVVPPNTDILKLFTDLNGEALILGTPKDSKNLLLELERSLKASLSQNNGDLSTPFVLNLLSWTRGQSLNDWLADAISQQYQISKDGVASQITSQKLSLLLDGLELMTVQNRNDCIEAINQFRASHREIDFAICGRIEDYDLMTSRFDLRSAIVLQ